MAVVIATNLRKELSGDPLFDGVSFKVERRDRLRSPGRTAPARRPCCASSSGETELHGGELAFAKGTRIALHDQRPPPRARPSLRDYVLSGAPTSSPPSRSCAGSSRRWPPASTTPRR